MPCDDALPPAAPLHTLSSRGCPDRSHRLDSFRLFHCPEQNVRLTGMVNQMAAGSVPFRFPPRLPRALATAEM
jgi:hypothetical protein